MLERSLSIIAGLLVFVATNAGAQSTTSPDRDATLHLVSRIQRADYEGDRAALKRLYAELRPAGAGESPGIAARVRYWRGYALWRRAFNGFNQSAEPADLARDLESALTEFEQALEHDPSFVDAKVGAISCHQNLGYLSRQDTARVRAIRTKVAQLFDESLAVAADNPRLLWILGVQRWYTPPERGGGQDVAMTTYQKGLDAARKQTGRESDPLEPTWGEPELLMNLAWSHLNKTKPDLRMAEKYAREALALVPYWSYLRDILLPQIQQTKRPGDPSSQKER